MSSEVSKYMAKIGRKGGKIGGKRRLETLSQEERTKIALRAARARWDKYIVCGRCEGKGRVLSARNGAFVVCRYCHGEGKVRK